MMRELPQCHWRRGGPCHGYVCYSAIAGAPGRHITEQDCIDCPVQNHFAVPERATLAALTVESLVPAVIVDQPLPVCETKVEVFEQVPEVARPEQNVPAAIAKLAKRRKR
jgi:hypothetical protein